MVINLGVNLLQEKWLKWTFNLKKWLKSDPRKKWLSGNPDQSWLTNKRPDEQVPEMGICRKYEDC